MRNPSKSKSFPSRTHKTSEGKKPKSRTLKKWRKIPSEFSLSSVFWGLATHHPGSRLRHTLGCVGQTAIGYPPVWEPAWRGSVPAQATHPLRHGRHLAWPIKSSGDVWVGHSVWRMASSLDRNLVAISANNADKTTREKINGENTRTFDLKYGYEIWEVQHVRENCVKFLNE